MVPSVCEVSIYNVVSKYYTVQHKINILAYFFRNNFLDKQLQKFPELLSEKCPDSIPVILLMDNINLYRGRRRHLRLFKSLGSILWNVTGRAVIISQLKDIESLMCCRETATMPQRDIDSIKANDLFLGMVSEFCLFISLS